MDEQGGGRGGGLLGGALGSHGGMGGGLGGAGPMGQLSPYLNIDPSYLSTETPQFIHNEVSCDDMCPMKRLGAYRLFLVHFSEGQLRPVARSSLSF